jgi:hypothetical protein
MVFPFHTPHSKSFCFLMFPWIPLFSHLDRKLGIYLLYSATNFLWLYPDLMQSTKKTEEYGIIPYTLWTTALLTEDEGFPWSFRFPCLLLPWSLIYFWIAWWQQHEGIEKIEPKLEGISWYSVHNQILFSLITLLSNTFLFGYVLCYNNAQWNQSLGISAQCWTM